MSRRTTALASLAALALAPLMASRATAANTRVVAWGDSITYGVYDGTSGADICTDGNPPNNPPESCGYPGRLGSRLNDPTKFSPIYDVQMLNLGKEGERTPQALTRMAIDKNVPPVCPCTALATPCAIDSLWYWFCNETVKPEDLFVLMEGTNDITRQEISLETVRANLQALGEKAASIGMNVVLSNLTPRHYNGWTKNDLCANDGNADAVTLNGLIGTTATSKGWPKVDPYAILSSFSSPFNNYYQNWSQMRCNGLTENDSGDPVGHPNRYGFDAIACGGTKTTACSTSNSNYPNTFEAVARGALPTRLTLTLPPAPRNEGTPLSFSVALLDLASYPQTVELTWSFGDGTLQVTQTTSTSPASMNHTFANNASYTVTVSVEHANGGTRSASALVAIQSVPTLLFYDGFETGDSSSWIVQN